MDAIQTAMIKGQRVLTDLLDNVNAENDKIKTRLFECLKREEQIKNQSDALQKEVDRLEVEESRSKYNASVVNARNRELEAALNEAKGSEKIAELNAKLELIGSQNDDLEEKVKQLEVTKRDLRQKVSDLETENEETRKTADLHGKQNECFEEQLRLKNDAIAEMEQIAIGTADHLSKVEAKHLVSAFRIEELEESLRSARVAAEVDAAVMTDLLNDSGETCNRMVSELRDEISQLDKDNALLRDQVANLQVIEREFKKSKDSSAALEERNLELEATLASAKVESECLREQLRLKSEAIAEMEARAIESAELLSNADAKCSANSIRADKLQKELSAAAKISESNAKEKSTLKKQLLDAEAKIQEMENHRTAENERRDQLQNHNSLLQKQITELQQNHYEDFDLLEAAMDTRERKIVDLVNRNSELAEDAVFGDCEAENLREQLKLKTEALAEMKAQAIKTAQLLRKEEEKREHLEKKLGAANENLQSKEQQDTTVPNATNFENLGENPRKRSRSPHAQVMAKRRKRSLSAEFTFAVDETISNLVNEVLEKIV